MPQSLSQVYAHLIFSTKAREPWLTVEVQNRLWRYLAGSLNAQECHAIKVGGYLDHVHILYRLSKNVAPSKVIGGIKAESSRWIKSEFPSLRDFAWQGGYGVFSVSASRVEGVSEYIANQVEHHRTVTFKEEFRNYLERHGVVQHGPGRRTL